MCEGCGEVIDHPEDIAAGWHVSDRGPRSKVVSRWDPLTDEFVLREVEEDPRVQCGPVVEVELSAGDGVPS